MHKVSLFLALVFCVGVSAVQGTIDPIHDPSLWNDLLLKYVRENGEIDGIQLNVVNYTGFAQDPGLQTWIDSLKTVSINNLTRDEIYAFFSNVYNTFAVNMMITNACKKDLFGNCGPIGSIRDISSIVPFKLVWDKPAGTLAGSVWSLQDVENYLLSPPRGIKPDPRVHSAIVCASVSCPNLRKGAYNYSQIDQQFNESFNNWVSNNKKGMSVDTQNSQVTLSMIFNWYESMFEDFFKNTSFSNGKGSVVKFILLYLDPKSPNYAWLSAHQDSVSVSYFNYDWNANVEGNMPCDSGSRPCYPLWALLVTIGGVFLVILIVVIVIVVRKKFARKHSYHRVNS